MPRRIDVPNNGSETFGRRLARVRKASGYTQQALASEIGISPRMVAYYEGETEHPPTALLPLIANTLGVTTDELLGVQPLPQDKKLDDARLWRRFKQAQKLSARDRRQIIQFIDTILERQRLKTKVAETS